jgi:hypothetical protein
VYQADGQLRQASRSERLGTAECTPQRLRKAEDAGGKAGGRGATRRRSRKQAGEQLPTADGGANSRQSRCGRAEMQGRGRGGRPADSSRGAAKPQAELEVHPPPSLSSSPFACTCGKCRAQSISCARSLCGRMCGQFPAPLAFRAGARSISRGARSFWRPSPAISRGARSISRGRAVDFPRSVVRGAAVGVRPTPICAYTTPNAIRRTPYQCRSWHPRRPASLPRLVA